MSPSKSFIVKFKEIKTRPLGLDIPDHNGESFHVIEYFYKI